MKTSTHTQERQTRQWSERTDGGRVPEQIVRRTRGAHDQIDVPRVDVAHLQGVPGRLDAQRAQILGHHGGGRRRRGRRPLLLRLPRGGVHEPGDGGPSFLLHRDDRLPGAAVHEHPPLGYARAGAYPLVGRVVDALEVEVRHEGPRRRRSDPHGTHGHPAARRHAQRRGRRGRRRGRDAMTGRRAMGRGGGGGEGAARGSAECGDGQRRRKEEFHFDFFCISLSLSLSLSFSIYYIYIIFPPRGWLGGWRWKTLSLLFLSPSSLGKRAIQRLK